MSAAGGGGPLHEQAPTSRFSDRADDYARYRPTYPLEAIDAVVALLPRGEAVVADVGAGTGISSRQVAEQGGGRVRVVAVEPNAAMRAAAAADPRVTFVDGTAEHTGLTTASVDAVLCAQAFHWFRHDEALAEFHRVLKPGGTVCLLWNDRDEGDPLTAGYGRAILEASGQHPAAKRVDYHEPLKASRLFHGFAERHFAHTQKLTLEGFIGRATSASYCPREGEAWDRLRAELTAMHARHADGQGVVAMRYVASLYWARRG